MNVVLFVILLAISVLLMGITYHNVRAEELKVLESQLNENSITGVIQNPYNYTIGGMEMKAEFYDKEDGHLVGLRDFYEVSKDELKPNEKASFKIFEHAGYPSTKEFPKTDFVVKAEGFESTNMTTKIVSAEEQIKGIEDLGKALTNLPSEVVVDVIENENGTQETVGKTITYENGTKEIVNKTGRYKITSNDNP
jgi:hypothetical protein